MNISLRASLVAIGVGIGVLAVTAGVWAATISGAGATFPYPVYAKWAGAYKGVTAVGLNYQSIGSGGGIAQIKAKTVTFGASDMPLTPSELNAAGLVQFPTVIGGVVPVVNISGVAAGQLVLDGKTMAYIFLGKITRWNDPAIRALNPTAKLPAQAIAVVHRSDGSGTTFVFSTYLTRISDEWKKTVGAATAVDWPLGIGAKGNEGVAGNVAQTNGSIGYVEYAYAKQNHLKFTRLINHDRKAVAPSAETFRTAAASADWAAAAKQGFFIILVDQPGAAAWPITATTYILVYRNPSDPAATSNVLKFFKWAYASGGNMAQSLDYVPLPDNAVKAVEVSWKQVKGSGM